MTLCALVKGLGTYSIVKLLEIRRSWVSSTIQKKNPQSTRKNLTP